jgi:hypothetical protein
LLHNEEVRRVCRATMRLTDDHRRSGAAYE